MNPVAPPAPVASTEAAALADLVVRQANGNPLTSELRRQIADSVGKLNFETIQPRIGSLERDPSLPEIYYIAADAGQSQGILLRLGNSPGGLFSGATPVADSAGVLPFGSRDHENIRKFAEEINRAFLPRPQRDLPAIAVGNRHPEISLPAAFAAFREIFENGGRNLASTVQLSATREMTTDEAITARDGETPTAAGHTRISIRHLYHAGLWAAIRAGWREGYTAEADHFIVSGNTAEEVARSVEATREAIRHAAGYTKFTTDTSRLFVLEADTRHPAPWSDAAVAERFESLFPAEEQKWVLAEFVGTFETGETAHAFSRQEVLRLAVKFGESLKLNEELYDYIRKTKGGHEFDFEPSIDEAETLTTPKELIFYMHWLRARGRAAQLVPPNLGFKKRQAYPESAAALHAYVQHKMWPELEARVNGEFRGLPVAELANRVRELAEVARHFDGTLSIHSGSGKQASVLETIGESTAGRVNYKISGELQLQLFDVLSEQPAGSPWRLLFERMCARANDFAAKGAFGAESELAGKFPAPYLGNADRGRVDGNLFLVFWLGNMAGSRDIHAPDGERRFFTEEFGDLPPDLLAEVRRRNARYIQWLARHLVG